MGNDPAGGGAACSAGVAARPPSASPAAQDTHPHHRHHLWGSRTAPHQHGGLHEPPPASPWGAGQPPVTVTFQRDTPQHHPLGSPLPASSSSGGRLDRPPLASPGSYTHIFPPPHSMTGWAGTPHQHHSAGWRADPHPNIWVVRNPPSPLWGWVNPPHHWESRWTPQHHRGRTIPPSPRGVLLDPASTTAKGGSGAGSGSPPVGLGCICAGGSSSPPPLSLQLKEGCLPMEDPQAGGMGAAGKAEAIFEGPQGTGEDRWGQIRVQAGEGGSYLGPDGSRGDAGWGLCSRR